MSIKHNLAAQVGQMSHQISTLPDHSSEEIEAIAQRMPVVAMKDANAFKLFIEKEKLSLTDCAVLVAWIDSMSNFLSDIKVTDKNATFAKAHEFFEKARTHTICIHRVNYIYHQCLIDVIDLLDKEKRLKFAVKKAANNAEKIWSAHINSRRMEIERSAWCTLQDHLRLVCDAVMPFIEKVYEAIRDNMIFLGMRDVEVKANCVVTLLMGKVAFHSFNAFFSDFEKECGINYSTCFAESNLLTMTKQFADVCNSIGLKTITDKYGCFTPADYDVEKCERFKVEWKRLIDALRNDDLMDENAQRAIDLNPDVKKEYNHIIADEEQKHLDADIKKLGEKFKVTKL